MAEEPVGMERSARCIGYLLKVSADLVFELLEGRPDRRIDPALRARSGTGRPNLDISIARPIREVGSARLPRSHGRLAKTHDPSLDILPIRRDPRSRIPFVKLRTAETLSAGLAGCGRLERNLAVPFFGGLLAVECFGQDLTEGAVIPLAVRRLPGRVLTLRRLGRMQGRDEVVIHFPPALGRQKPVVDLIVSLAAPGYKLPVSVLDQLLRRDLEVLAKVRDQGHDRLDLDVLASRTPHEMDGLGIGTVSCAVVGDGGNGRRGCIEFEGMLAHGEVSGVVSAEGSRSAMFGRSGDRVRRTNLGRRRTRAWGVRATSVRSKDRCPDVA
ncbi:hypothetical protein [Methylobacterium haplocladii]|nr:hypothetical protein [Methylobacterium haplocladii]